MVRVVVTVSTLDAQPPLGVGIVPAGDALDSAVAHMVRDPATHAAIGTDGIDPLCAGPVFVRPVPQYGVSVLVLTIGFERFRPVGP